MRSPALGCGLLGLLPPTSCVTIQLVGPGLRFLTSGYPPVLATRVLQLGRVFTGEGMDGQQSSNHVWENNYNYWQESVPFSRSSCLTLCDPMNRSTPDLPVHHQLLEFTQTNIHRVSDAIQPSHPLSSPSPPAPKSLPASESFPMSQLFT